MKNLTSVVAIILVLILLPRIINRIPYFRKPDFQARQIARDNLPGWLKIYYVFSFLILWLLIGFAFLSSAAFVYGLIHPGAPFMGDQSLSPSFFSNLLVGLRLLSAFLLLPLGMIVSNLIAHAIPSIRRIESHASKGIPSASFGEANKGLLKVARITVPVALVILIATMFF